MGLTSLIAGSWRGKYFYDASELQAHSPAGVGFELHLTQTCWQRIWGRFGGTVTDDPPFGVPGEGKITAKLAGNRLRFTKLLPELHVAGSEGPMPLRDYLIKHDFLLRRLVAHPPICYEGSIVDDGSIRGSWKMRPMALRLDVEGPEIQIPCGTGTFHMEKQ